MQFNLPPPALEGESSRLLHSPTDEVILSIDGDQSQSSPAKLSTDQKPDRQMTTGSSTTTLRALDLDVVRCPVCKANTFLNEFTRSGITLALLFFPVGLLFCILLTEKRCESCGYKA